MTQQFPQCERGETLWTDRDYGYRPALPLPTQCAAELDRHAANPAAPSHKTVCRTGCALTPHSPSHYIRFAAHTLPSHETPLPTCGDLKR